MKLAKGVIIGVPCEVKSGPFSGEHLISFDTVNGPISGFVRDSELKHQTDQWYVRAIVQSAQNDSVTVRVHGSFFTTNGIATISAGAALAA